MNTALQDKLLEYLKKPAVLHIALVLVAVLVWGQALNYISKNHLWTIFGSRLDGYEAHLAQSALLKTKPNERFDYMVVGDGLFIKRMKAHLPKDKKTLYLIIPQLDLRDIKKVFAVTRGVFFRRAFVQDSPYLWSNLRFREYGPEFNVWQFRIHQARQGFELVPSPGIKLFFDVLAEWAAGPPEDQVLDYARPSLTGLTFQQVKIRFRKKARKRIYWVYDLAKIDLKTNPELVRQHKKWRATAGKDGSLGKFVSLRFVKRMQHDK